MSGLADSRKSLFDYDQVLNTQRDKVYAIRRQALLSDDLSGLMLDFSGRTMDDILEVRALAALMQSVCVCMAAVWILVHAQGESIALMYHVSK